MVFQNNVLSGAAGSGTTAYAIDQSIRFDAVNKSFITEDSGGGFVKETTSTISMWVKRGGIYIGSGTRNVFYGAFYGNSGRYDYMQFDSSDRWEFGTLNTDATTSTGTNSPHRVTNMVFRDPAAWYHLVIVLDSTNAVASERIRMFVNGERITSFATETAIPQNRGFYTMSAGVENNVGAFQDDTSYNQELYFDGCMAEVALIDGTAYDASNFGEYNSSNIWIPKDISELTFGSNGIYYKGQDSSALGDDSSGNGNDGTVRNLGAHDQMLDTPTNNFCTPNPLDNYYCACTFNNANMIVDTSNTPYSYFTTTQKIPTSGKWYAECRAYDTTGHMLLGIAQEIAQNNQHYLGHYSTNYAYYNYNGKSITGTTQSTYGNTYTNGDIIGIAVDMDNNKLYFSKNGTFQNSGAPTSGSTGTGAISITGGVDYFYAGSDYGSGSGSDFRWNFGQDPTFSDGVTAGGNSDANGIGNFKYSVPSGYLALCTKNLGS